MATAAKDWKKGKSDKNYELEVPSGNTCLVRRPGPQALLQSGSIPNSLLGVVMPLLEEAEKKGKQGDSSPTPDAAMADLQKAIIDDPEKLQDMFAMVDHVALQCVIAPHLTPASVRAEILANEELTQEEKDAQLEELLFVDDVDFEDKMVIFNYAVGGTADLERFRAGTQALVAAGQDGPAVHDPTE